MALVGTFVKRTDETFALYDKSIDWEARLQTGATVSAVTVYVYAQGAETVDLAATMAPGGGTVVGGRYTTCVITGGTDGVIYHVHHVVTTSLSAIFDDHIAVYIRDCTATAPGSDDSYMIYGFEFGLDGNLPAAEGDVVVTVVTCDQNALYTAADGSLRRLVGTEYETDSDGKWAFYIAKAAVETRTEICLAFEYATGTPTKVLKLAMMDETVANPQDQIAFAAWKPRIRSGSG
jgi:hypothetical protein